ncbi:uncharacterized protein BP5553_04099 [Venustampulla echinocandica]|uniref:Uncharacterized protein n=1 Tax=Venustampulla echinocandica TaxID=2656787 RepID=A0A370TW64_9HELO|nr:uncharacterized protein BP5553_04099 [Venustampulla echinocandica]RDL39759.1 hypothetical protein BP5553_04099 [Venustampulla echinocandica]
MESISNIASAASRAIWGEQGQHQDTVGSYNDAHTTKTNETGGKEPISGEMGNVARGEPYDKGNLDPSTTKLDTTSSSVDPVATPYATGSSSTPSSRNPTSTTTNPYSESRPAETYNSFSESSAGYSGNNPSTSASNVAVSGYTPHSENGPTGPRHAESETGKTAKSSFSNLASPTSTVGPTNANDNSGPGAAPSVGADASSGARPKVKQQGADKPHDQPDSVERKKIQDTKQEAEDAAATSKSVDGPGPMSLEEKGRNGGNAASGGDEVDGHQQKSTGEGTGEKYVKSSGMKAEGGDFDAANPGAGKEADRLLEEKGVHREVEAKHASDDAIPSGETKPHKRGLGEKIKTKLHKH